MKSIKKLSLIFIAAAAAALLSASCNKKDSVIIYQGIVTVKDASDGSCQLQLDENTVLIPTNGDLKTNPFKKEVRAYTHFVDNGTVNEIGSTKYKSADIYKLDSILTKKLAPSLGADNDAVYGTAPIEIYNSWMTVVEDGYITIHFTGKWSGRPIVHTINLLKNTTEDPLTLELRHNYNGDPVEQGYYWGDGIAAFDIKELLQDKKDSYDIVVKYKGSGYDKSITFHYIPGSSVLATSNESKYKSSLDSKTMLID